MSPRKVVVLHRWQVAAAFVFLALSYAGGLLWLSILAAGGQQAHDGLCALRQDLQRRVAAGTRFLSEHPNGFAGIPAAVIAKSVHDQQRTIDTLRPLHCPDAVELP